nr:hypothetical protein [Tanacetum cinerariifolium]
MQENAKESCMTSFQLLHSFLQVLSYDESKSRRVSERAFMILFGQDNETFTSTTFLYLGQLQNQPGKDEFQEDKSMAAFWVLNNQFQKFIDWQYYLDYDGETTEMLFAEYIGIKVKQFRETLLLHMGNVKKYVVERIRLKKQYDRRMNERQMQSRESKVVSSKALDVSLVVTECSGTKSDEHITSSRKGFTIAALKNELRKLKGNSVDTKFAKPSILRKPVLQPPRNQNSQEESYGLHDIAHNHYLEEAWKKTQERNRNSKSSVMHTTSIQITTNGSKQKPRSNNQTSRSLPVSKSSGVTLNGVTLVDKSRNSSSFSDSKHFVCSTCQKCVFNANHDDCIKKFPKEVNSCAKVQSPKSKNNIKPAKRIPNVNKPERWISKGYRFSPNKSFAVNEKPNTPRSCLRWKPTVPTAVAAPRAIDPAGLPSSTTIDQDVP